VNPVAAERQIEMQMVMGLAAALRQEITIEKGRTVQSIFKQLSLAARDGDAGNPGPLVRARTIRCRDGEEALGWVAPSVCNAILPHGEADSFAAPQESQPQLGDCLILMTRR